MDLDTLSARVARSASTSCPGGIGNFGFNSYDMMTFSLLVMGAVTSAVIVNTNKNENNDNNNDLEAAFGQINTNNQMASSDQTNMNMAIITVPPTGTPVVVPAGRMLDNKTMAFLPETRFPDFYWESEQFQVFENGTIIDKSTREKFKGTVAMGTIDSQNIFHRLENFEVDWSKIRGPNRARSSADVPPIIPFDAKPVFVPVEEIDELFQESVLENGLTLVQIAIPEVGPPIVLPVGALLDDGRVFLNDGMEVDGAYFESPDRILYENGTIYYKLTNTLDHATMAFATMDQKGRMIFLPKLGPRQVSMDILKDMNAKPSSRRLQITLQDFAMNQDTWKSIRDNYNSSTRRKKRSGWDSVLGKLRHSLTLSQIFQQLNAPSETTEKTLCQTFVKLDENEQLRNIVFKYKPEHMCFFTEMIRACQNFFA